MAAKKKKIVIIGLVILMLVVSAGIGIYLYNKDKTDYVFEGTFVKETSVQKDNKTNENDCFKINYEEYFV